MSNNAQKTPLSRSLSGFATQKAVDEIMKRGQALPGIVSAVNGSIVTVNFQVRGITLPQVTMPVFGPEYIRYPIQVGDKGVAFPASVYLGGVSGLGGGIADTTLRGNLSTLVWFPIGNSNWFPVKPTQLVLYGPNGVILQDTSNTASIDLTGNQILMTTGGNSITISASGITLTNGTHTIVINSTGVVIDGRIFLAHEHSAVQTGSGVSGGVV